MKTSWRHVNAFLRNNIPISLRTELLCPNSTTKKFSQLDRTLKTVIRDQSWKMPTQDEAQLLRIKPRTLALIREVDIYANDEPWMFGRSVFPADTLSGDTRFLKKSLDERPLGTVLFAQPSLQRSDFELAHLKDPQLEYQWVKPLLQQDEELWARRSIFKVLEKPILLTEIFLPALVEFYAKNN